MNILGINAYHGDVSAVFVRDGDLVAAVEEERFRRIKHVAGFPTEAIRACLRMAGVTGRDIDHVAVSRDPRAHLWRKGLFALRRRPSAHLLGDRARNYRHVANIPERLNHALGLTPSDRQPRVHWVEHHPAHLASAFFVSPFDEAAVCAIDGFGDFVSTSSAIGRGSTLKLLDRTYFPHSLGVLYLALTQFLGFEAFGDEYKVMGLAAYGAPDYERELSQLIKLRPAGRFELDLSYFTHWSGGASMTWEDGEPKLGRVFSPKLERLLGPARTRTEPVTPHHQAIAASLQRVFEDAVFHVLGALHARAKLPQLCLAGGCAMNSVANGKIRERTPFTDVYIQPAAADNGTALGAAYWVWHHVLRQPRSFVMRHGYWGPAFAADAIAATLAARQADLRAAKCTVHEFAEERNVCDWTARQLANGRVVGWFQGSMEWGARALGNRSILADPRRANMRETLNAKIKCRERFRPFAPSVLDEARHQYFEDSVADPFMMQVYPVRADKQAVIPAVTHVDGSGRLQSVQRDVNARYWALIRAFERETGIPMLLNTSFNESEPIVHDPGEALDCFLRTDMDVLVLGDTAITKREEHVS